MSFDKAKDLINQITAITECDIHQNMSSLGK